MSWSSRLLARLWTRQPPCGQPVMRRIANSVVIAIDSDLTRLGLARHNALQLGVADRIEFIHGDYVDFARSYASKAGAEAIDVVFLSPPWGE